MNDAIVCVYVPLCSERCAFCTRLRVPATISLVDRYTEALLSEIDAAADELSGGTVRAVRFTGGVPLMLAGHNIARIVHRLERRFHLEEGAEITVETVQGKIDEHNFRLFKTIGVNRVEFLYPTGTTVEHRRLRCPGDFGQIHDHNAMRRAFGLENWSLRLLCGLPGQSDKAWRTTLDKACALDPPHVTLETVAQGETPGGEEAAFARYSQAADALRAAGYRRYAEGCFARAGWESRFSTLLHEGADVLGFGVGASTFANGVSYRTCDDVHEYLSHAGDMGATARDLVLPDAATVEKKYVCDRLKLEHGFSPHAFEQRFGRPVGSALQSALDDLVLQGLALCDRREGRPRFRLTDRGCFMAESVARSFDHACLSHLG